jgi:anaerobic carbon-monoxide dehydrogenase iron sulfur subunit
MAKVLFVDPAKCVGCLSCMCACSLQHGNHIGPTHSMINPVRLLQQVKNIPIVCRQCLQPLCADVCPMRAISRDEKTGAMVVDADLCIGCRMCMSICPLGGIAVSTDIGHAVKCDLCQGDPLCVKVCTYGGIKYIDEAEVTLARKNEAVSNIAAILKELTF